MANPNYDTDWNSTPQPKSRFESVQNYLKNPENQDHAIKVAREIGSVAIMEAVKGSGFAKYDKDGNLKLRKGGIVRAVLQPKRALRKAAVGAFQGARQGAIDETRDQARSALHSAVEHGYDYGKNQIASRLDTPPAIENYATPLYDNWGDSAETAPRPFDAVAESRTDNVRGRIDDARDKLREVFGHKEELFSTNSYDGYDDNGFPIEAAQPQTSMDYTTDSRVDKTRGKLRNVFGGNKATESAPVPLTNPDDEW